MELHVAQHNLGGLAVQFQVQDRSVESFLLQSVEQVVVIDFDLHSILASAKQDARGLTSNTQAAARTRTLQIARSCDDLHNKLQFEWTATSPTRLITRLLPWMKFRKTQASRRRLTAFRRENV